VVEKDKTRKVEKSQIQSLAEMLFFATNSL